MIELQEEMETSTNIVEDFNTLLSITDRSSKKKISKDTEDFSNTINQVHKQTHTTRNVKKKSFKQRENDTTWMYVYTKRNEEFWK